ncbi:MAG: histidine kinase, partial [Thermonemataceae bacterium]|nr:histidine kinase [Thermonemataceae bacterium]
MDTSEKGWFFTILLAGSFLLFVFGVFVVWLIVAFQQKLLKKELLSQKELTKVSIDAQEKERERIAQELHDEVSAMLSAAKMQVAYLPYINDEQKRKESLAESKKMLETSLNQIRNLSHQLSPSILVAFGLENSIQNYLQSIKDLICIDFI